MSCVWQSCPMHSGLNSYPLFQCTGIPATEALRKGLEDLRDQFQHIHTTFEVRIYIFKIKSDAVVVKMFLVTINDLILCQQKINCF